MTRKLLALAALTTIAACSDPGHNAYAEGPTARLSAGEMEEFEIDFCLEGPALGTLTPFLRVVAEGESKDDAEFYAILYRDGEEPVEVINQGGAHDNFATAEANADRGAWLGVDLDGEYRTQTGRRCAEPWVLRIERLDDGERTLEVDWEVRASMTYVPDDGFNDDALSLKIERR